MSVPRRAAPLLLLWLAGLAPAPAGAADDAAVYALIESLRPVAAALTVDGDASDWGAIPAFPDPTGDAGGDASRDITSVRIAPTDDALAVLIETAGAPSQGGYAFWIQIDFTGLAFPDVEIALDATGPDGLSWFEESGCGSPPCSTDWDESELAIGSAVEIRVPYAELDAALPASLQGKLSGSGARSWLRVWVHAIDYPPPDFFYTEVDHGSTVASFRLVETPYPLDPPLPPGGSPYTALPPPLPGLWYVGQGAMTHGSHTNLWAYDLHRTDNALHPESPVESPNLADNYSFGEPILAPAAGTVFSLANDDADHPPYDDSPPPPANFLFLEIPGNLGLLFSHTKQGSISAAQDDALGAGAYVGQVGHSGATGWPHLHYEAQQIDAGFASRPLGLADAGVGLNPSAGDPWRRQLASWGLREGFFVLPEPGVPAGVVAGIAALSALAGRRRAMLPAMHRVVGCRSGRRTGGPSLRARFGALLAVVAVALLAAPFASGALEPIEQPHLVAASSSAPALTPRADERASGSTPLRSLWALPRSAAHPGIQTRRGISARRDAAELQANRPLLRWVLGHGTTTSLP